MNTWFLSKIIDYLSGRLSGTQISDLSKLNVEIFSQLAKEIQVAIDNYNNFPQSISHLDLSPGIFINALHTKKIWVQPLPDFVSILKAHQSDTTLTDQVFSEHRDSSYFQVIYQLDDPRHELANLMVQFYRTSLLLLYPGLRSGGVQISSTIEEMAALNYLSGSDTLLFHATKHWLIDWQGEGFSQQLSKLIT